MVYSFQRAIGLAKGNSWMIRDIVTAEGVKAMHATTVEFGLATPFAAFLQVLPWIFIVEKAEVEAILGADMGQTWLLTNTAGSGPFQIARAEVGMLYHLARLADAWQPGGGNLGGVIWQIVRETATQRPLLQRGEAHIAVDLTSEDMDSLGDAPSVVRVLEPAYRTFSIKMNTKNGPLSGPNMRKAISHATNYQAIVDPAGYANLMTEPLPDGVLGPNPDLGVYRMDLDKAKEHLAKTATPEGGFTLKMVHVSGLEQQRRWALIMLDSLKQINIDLEIQPLKCPDMVAACASPETFPDLFPVYQTANYGNPDNIAFAAYQPRGLWLQPAGRWPARHS